MSTFKFGIPDEDVVVPFNYPSGYCYEQTTGPDRLVIAPASGRVDLMVDLVNLLPEPFGVLYVLVVSRLDSELGRYQCPEPMLRDELVKFLSEFHDFFELDGRHNIWVTSLPASATLVYTRNNLLYAYGPLERFAESLEQKGLQEEKIKVPSDHAHFYHAEFDAGEAGVLKYWNWTRFPLVENDLY